MGGRGGGGRYISSIEGIFLGGGLAPPIKFLYIRPWLCVQVVEGKITTPRLCVQVVKGKITTPRLRLSMQVVEEKVPRVVPGLPRDPRGVGRVPGRVPGRVVPVAWQRVRGGGGGQCGGSAGVADDA